MKGYIIFVTICIALGQCAELLQIDEFTSLSFVPDDIKISFIVKNKETLSYNLTIAEQFPGRILLNVFVRKLADGPGKPRINFIKLRNLDFCKSLESMRNLTSTMPSTFLISCPLTPGFYYVENAVVDPTVFPIDIPNGRYFVVLELLQVYEEVTLLVNSKFKCTKRKPEGIQEDEEQMDDDKLSGK